MSLRIGIDIGSTTVKVVVLDEQNKLLFRSYERHYSKTRERACETLHSIGRSAGGPTGESWSSPAPPAWGGQCLPALTLSRRSTPPPPR